MVIEKLFQEAKSLPLEPGVYIMYNAQGTIIYIGKAKKLRNRVSQYFTGIESHNAKTYRMVTNVDHFEVILARSEFEALVLECTLIKQHKPKYNILLKDDKGFPVIRIDMKAEYPKMELASKRVDDGAQYFGPYGGRYLTANLIDTIQRMLHLPLCGKVFPRDIGKERPCLNFHMNFCDGWCRLCKTGKEYEERINQAVLILQGKQNQVAQLIHERMEEAAENLDFELAAELRDRYKSLESLKERTMITTGVRFDIDVIGYYAKGSKVCFSVLHYVSGTLLDKDFNILTDSDELESFETLLEQYYLRQDDVPKLILVSELPEDSDILAGYLTEKHGHKVEFHVPVRGERRQMLEIAEKNAMEELERTRTKDDKNMERMEELGQLLGLKEFQRIESYDISHIAGTDIVASMVVYENGRLKKSDYKRFKLENMDNQDDYGAMQQVLSRRLAHYKAGDNGFAVLPDLFLIDGGAEHAAVAERVLGEYGINRAVVGMVKDNKHRTRALIYSDSKTVDIMGNTSVFSLVGTIQEETHRFAITYHRMLRSKRLSGSKLDNIPGIGEKRKQQLLKHFSSIKAISNAEIPALELILPHAAAVSVYNYFHETKENREK